jgi:sterol desaturase/sphingolipid hydroxylase (fatty acid hydroxylase superfamily)
LDSFWKNAVWLWLIIFFRYSLLAGAFHWGYLKFGVSRKSIRMISPVPPTRHQIRSEVFWSSITSGIFAFTGAWGLSLWQQGRTLVYFEVSDYGWPYFFVSILVYAIFHETYFYWTHRILHVPFLLKKVHSVHHEYRDPSAWAAFSFHPIEGIVQAMILPLLVIWIPIHVGALLIFLILMSLTGVLNHTGLELFPSYFAEHPMGKWLISATHHHQHHQLYAWNFGLYFTFWDRWMRTQSPSYEAVYLKIKKNMVSSRNEKLLTRV